MRLSGCYLIFCSSILCFSYMPIFWLQVYHAKFFNICKKRKAVKEAFDFIRLIPNPMLSTFNMLMSVCASSQDSEGKYPDYPLKCSFFVIFSVHGICIVYSGAFQVLQLLKDARLEPDCKLYTTLILTCAKSGKVDLMFEVQYLSSTHHSMILLNVIFL